MQNKLEALHAIVQVHCHERSSDIVGGAERCGEPNPSINRPASLILPVESSAAAAVRVHVDRSIGVADPLP